MNLVCVPLYDTFGEDAVQYVMSHSEVKVVCCEGKKLKSISHILRELNKDQVKAVVYWGEAPQDALQVRRGGGVGRIGGAQQGVCRKTRPKKVYLGRGGHTGM